MADREAPEEVGYDCPICGGDPCLCFVDEDPEDENWLPPPDPDEQGER